MNGLQGMERSPGDPRREVALSDGPGEHTRRNPLWARFQRPAMVCAQDVCAMTCRGSDSLENNRSRRALAESSHVSNETCALHRARDTNMSCWAQPEAMGVRMKVCNCKPVVGSQGPAGVAGGEVYLCK